MISSDNKFFRFTGILQAEGWLMPAYVGVNDRGIITYLSQRPPTESIAVESILGLALPGFQNAHSHAFQYAMAGLAEQHPAGTEDDFWSWREAMYQCALSVNPEQVEAIATMLYAEMLRVGYTHVAEFHYLHHDPNGKPYANRSELGERMVAAAKRAGIGITLIPVFYQQGGFGKEPQPRQRRFISKTIDAYWDLVESSKHTLSHYDKASLGISTHSLRAVELEDVKKVAMASSALPFHMHVAEQKREIEDCLAYCGKRPMEWVLDHLPVDERFHLVHATHLDDSEVARLARSGAHVVLCPSTEGNLGDGIFRMKEYVERGGRWSIGTDSHIGLNPLEEFRMMDYRQRLITHHRNTFADDAAQYLIHQSVTGGRKAMGISSTQHFEIGKPFDAVVLDAEAPLLAGTRPQHLAASIVYSSDTAHYLGTLVSGKWIVKHHQHLHQSEIRQAFHRAMKEIAIR